MKIPIACTLIVAASLARCVVAQNPEWHREFPGFNIADNLYYVGTADLAVYLVKTPQGNVLINSDFPQDLPAIKKSIRQLGFEYLDTKIILISHAHDDHDGAVGLIKQETGARLMVMAPDVSSVESKNSSICAQRSN